MKKTNYCTYCRSKKKEGTKFYIVRDRRTGRIVNRKCEDCKKKSTLPEAERDRLGRVKAAELRAEKTRVQQTLRADRLATELEKKRKEKL